MSTGSLLEVIDIQSSLRHHCVGVEPIISLLYMIKEETSGIRPDDIIGCCVLLEVWINDLKKKLDESFLILTNLHGEEKIGGNSATHSQQ